MAMTESTMVDLGTVAPPFELTDVVSGRAMSRDDVFSGGGQTKRAGLLVMFVCVHCPYVKHLEAELGKLGTDYDKGGDGPIALVAIQSNDVAQYPLDGPEGMRDQAARMGWTFPYLLDETQEVAREYGAACTPDFFLFDAEMKLAYRGQFDDSRPQRKDAGNNLPVTGKDLRAAMDALIAGAQPTREQRSSIGCNIKWREA